jgi:hypothetical protein
MDAVYASSSASIGMIDCPVMRSRLAAVAPRLLAVRRHPDELGADVGGNGYTRHSSVRLSLLPRIPAEATMNVIEYGA